MNEKTVGMLAKFTGVSVHTIKYYEKIGLLSSTRREHSNYRSYDIRACTDIYECVKYKNLGFALKEVGNLIKEADSEAIDNLLKKRLEEIDASLSELQELKKRVTDYLAETEEIEKKQGNWYIEEMPDFWIRFQTNNLEYGKNAQLESDGINFMDYAPESKSVLKISRESLNGTENQFSWGQAVRAEYIEDIEKNENVWSRQKGYTRIKGGRAFVLYLKITGPYASEGVLQKKIRKIYRKFQQDAKIPGDAYCVRINMSTLDLIPVSSYKINNIEKRVRRKQIMTSEEIKNMSFEDFRTQIEGMEEVQKLTADGTERYGIYKHDVCYVNRDGIERTLQMIVPETNAKAPKTYPAILYVQGSAWRKQDNYKRLGAMADLARRGFVTAILQYRESDLATFPAPVEDAKTGVRFLRKHAEEYRIDPSQVFIMGDSSGGNTAFIAGVTADQELMDTDVYGEYSCKVNAIVDFYGVTCVQIKEDFPTTLNQGEPDSPEGMLIGKKNVYEYPELSNAVTCMNYVKKETEIPPVLMMHGLADDLVAPEQSIRLYKKLREEDKEVEFYLVENAKHGDPAFWTEKNMDIVEKFLKAHMN